MNFHAPTIQDAIWAIPILESNNYLGSEYAFSNAFMWQEIALIELTQFQDFVLIRADYKGDHINYQYPCGRGDVRVALDKIFEISLDGDRPPAITSILDDQKEIFESLYPDMFTFTNPRGNSDYVYLSSDLADLPGKKFQKKRNHCSRFERSYPNWSFHVIKEEDLPLIRSFTKKWLEQNENEGNLGMQEEQSSIARGLNNFFELGLKGGYILVDDEMVAYSYGYSKGDEFITHVEKGLYSINGVYAVINREMARHFGKDHKYINREDDLGEEGLRKSKLSYRPTVLVNKWRAEPKVWPPSK